MANDLLQQLSDELSATIETASRSTVLLRGRRFHATGLAWQKTLIVTADHSLPRVAEIGIMLPSGEELVATVAGRDPSIDIAVLRTTTDLQSIGQTFTGAVKAGQLALVVARASRGRSLALLSMISGSAGSYKTWRGGTLDQFIRLDTLPFPGFSGSVLVLPNGQIVGVNTAVFSRNFGITVPASNIERLVAQIAKKGSVGRPYLGLMMQPVRLPENFQRESGGEIGMLVLGTEKDSPAEHAGFLMGDILVGLNGKQLSSMEDIHDSLSHDAIGTEMKITILRGGKIQEITAKVGERPVRQNKK